MFSTIYDNLNTKVFPQRPDHDRLKYYHKLGWQKLPIVYTEAVTNYTTQKSHICAKYWYGLLNIISRHRRDRLVVRFTTTYAMEQCRSPLKLRVRISIRARCTTLCNKVCQLFATGGSFSPGPLFSSTNKTDRNDITEILLNVGLNTIKPLKSKIILVWP